MAFGQVTMSASEFMSASDLCSDLPHYKKYYNCTLFVCLGDGILQNIINFYLLNIEILYPYTRISIYPYTRISVYPYIRISVYPYTRISLYPYTHIPVYKYTRISVYPYIRISVYPYIRIPVYPYTRYPYIRISVYPIPVYLYPVPCRSYAHLSVEQSHETSPRTLINRNRTNRNRTACVSYF